MTKTPASIRYWNPGAQYPGPSAQRFGSIGTEVIGGGHKIAVFDDPVKGAAAQFDLLSRRYSGMPLADAIRKWSGGNSSGAYAAKVAQETGLSPDTVLTPEMFSNPAVAVPLARTMASWEAGRPYPMTDEQWTNAHRMALGGNDPRNVAPSGGGYGVDPDGAAGVSGAIHSAQPKDAGVSVPFSMSPATGAFPQPTMMAQTEAAPGFSLPFGMSLGATKPPEIPEAQAPQRSALASLSPRQIDLSQLMQLAGTRRKLGV